MNNNQPINREQLHRWISALALITFDVDEGTNFLIGRSKGAIFNP